MKRLSLVLAALATLAVAAPAVAQDKPMMRDGMHTGMGMHRGMHHKMMMRHKMRHMRRHMMKQGM
jgi:hypothetical protein